MIKKILCAATLFVCISAVTGCNIAGSASGVDTLTVDSIKYTLSDSLLTCEIVADIPQGSDSLSMSVRSFVNAQLDSLSSARRNASQADAGYTGDMADGQAMIDFYGKLNVDSMRAMQLELAGISELSCSYMASVRLAAETKNYATYSVLCYTYMGGAHGSTVSYARNIIKPSGKLLQLSVDTTKVKEMQPLLIEGVSSYLSEAGQKMAADEVLKVLFIDNGIIPLPAFTPYLTPEGLCFIYQQYEIGPYAMGMVTFTIPYDKVKPYMTAEALQLIAEGQPAE